MITSILSFIVAFGILVLVHEFGHFWVARKVGIAVEKFSIGFGPKIFGFVRKGTEFCISVIPLGGFVKMRGDDDETQVSPDDKTAFVNKSVAARSAVVLAGPFMNILLSFILMPLVFWMGKPEPTYLKEVPVVERVMPASPADKNVLKPGDKILAYEGKPVPTWEVLLESIAITPAGKVVVVQVEQEGVTKNLTLETASFPNGEGSYLGIEKFFGTPPDAVIKEVIPDSPAAKAGLQKGDKITAVEGKTITNWDDLLRAVNATPDKPLAISILRDGASQQMEITPKWDSEAKRWLIGIKGSEPTPTGLIQIRHYSFLEAVKVGFKANIRNIGLTFQVLKRLLTFQLSYKNLGGPVQIAYSLSQAASSGLADFLYFTSFLSLQLAILNILPIPMLDGGHLLFFGIEAIRRKPLSLKIRLWAQQAGLVLLLTLIVLVTFNDLKRLLFH